MRLLFWLREFRACRWLLPPHIHVSGLCMRNAVERYVAFQSSSTYRLYYLFRLWELNPIPIEEAQS